jgi:catechol 2,3-dioxygenase-like lactoylglutathione lyase family enzyme
MDIRIAVVSLWAEDVPAAAHFYRDVIGLPLLPHFESDRPHFDLGGTILTIICGRPALPPGSELRFPVVAFSIPDLDAGMEKLRTHAVNLPWGVESNASSRWVLFRDPQGNLIELVEFKRPELHKNGLQLG